MNATSLDLTGKVEPLVAELLADVVQALEKDCPNPKIRDLTRPSGLP